MSLGTGHPGNVNVCYQEIAGIFTIDNKQTGSYFIGFVKDLKKQPSAYCDTPLRSGTYYLQVIAYKM